MQLSCFCMHRQGRAFVMNMLPQACLRYCETAMVSEARISGHVAFAAQTHHAVLHCCLPSRRDPSSRPSALQALEHPWLQKGNTRQRLQGAQLTQVQPQAQNQAHMPALSLLLLPCYSFWTLARWDRACCQPATETVPVCCIAFTLAPTGCAAPAAPQPAECLQEDRAGHDGK